MTGRIGILGGTFNPIHLGHVQAADQVRAAMSMDKILFVPSYIPPHKEARDIAPAADRFRMVELACLGHEGFEASSVEVEAKEKSYSILTLDRIKRRYPERRVFFIVGVDAFLEIGTWHEVERVIEQGLFAVMDRPGFDLRAASGVLGGRLAPKVHAVRAGEIIDDALFSRFSVFLLPIQALDISSTDVRDRLRHGRSIAELVPGPVAEYITSHHLYTDR